MSKPLHIAYIATQYPALSHSFIQREVRALRELGVNVETFSIRSTPPQMSASDREEQSATTTILPPSARVLILSHLSALRRSPGAYISTLRFALSRGLVGPKKLLWQVFYFVEAIILWKQCNDREITHIHAHFANAGSDVARLAASFARAAGDDWRWSFTMHGSAEFLDIKGFRLAQKTADADMIVCISDYARSQLMWLVDSSHWDKLQVVHCGVDTSCPPPFPRNRTPSDPFHILTIGRLIPLKGQALLIEACAELRRRGIDASLRVIGSGPESASLEAAVAKHDLAGHVELLGAVGQDDIWQHFEWADAFCQPSMMEGLPVVLIEAMERSIPVVATAITGVPELIDDDVTGLLTRPGRVDLLANALETLAGDPAKAVALADAARQTILEQFDIATTAEQLKGLFEEMTPQAGLAQPH